MATVLRPPVSPPDPNASRQSAGWALLGKLAGITVVVTTAVLVHGVNMLSYPYFEGDEGTYVAQAWAVLNEGQLAPYTYFYDHAPGGWLQIAAWQLLTGGANNSFGDAIASGRVFMLVVHVIATMLVIVAGRAVSGKLWVGLLAGAIFALSPYGLGYHRRVLLDNLAAVWMLVSFLVLLRKPVRLKHVWLSAVALAVAVWSKEVAVALLPAMAVFVGRQTAPQTRLLAVGGWLAICFSLISVYPLMALLKGELFATGSPLGGDDPHVSLLCSLQWQASRGIDGGMTDLTSAFWRVSAGWADRDPLLVIGGTAAALVFIVGFRREPPLAMLGWIVVSFWLFLGRGGMILDFYLVPLLPFLAVGVAALTWRLTDLLAQRGYGRMAGTGRGLGAILATACIGGLVLQLSQPDNRVAWQAQPVAGQKEAVTWVQQNLPPGSRIIMDMYMWVDLHDPRGVGQEPFTRAHYYWKAAQDPAVQRVFGDDWREVDYVVTTPQLMQDTQVQGFPIVRAALDHSRSIARFDTGVVVEVRKVDPRLATNEFGWEAADPASEPDCMNVGQ